MTEERRSRLRRGTSIVEMAIVLPLLLLVVFAIGEFGLAFVQWQTLNSAAREGARAGVVFRAPCAPAQVDTDVQTAATAVLTNAGVTGASISPNGQCGGSGTQLTVTVAAPFNFAALPGLTALVGAGGFLPTVNLTATSVMRNE